MFVLISFPLMLLPLAVYNVLVLSGNVNPWEDVILRNELSGGGQFTMTLGEALIVVSLLLLFVEILKATRVASSSIVDHLLSTAVFVAFLVEFLLVDWATTSTFFILTVIALIDVIAGYSVSIRNASRDLTIDR